MNQIEIYQTSDGQTAVEVRFDGDTFWLNQYQLADLFQTDRTSILKHLQNIYSTKELYEEATCAKFAQVRKEGKREVKREVLHYNLDASISVGYRVNSARGTQFRQWATQRQMAEILKLLHRILPCTLKKFAPMVKLNRFQLVRNTYKFRKKADEL